MLTKTCQISLYFIIPQLNCVSPCFLWSPFFCIKSASKYHVIRKLTNETHIRSCLTDLISKTTILREMPQETEQRRLSSVKSIQNIIDSIIYAVFSTCTIAWMKPAHGTNNLFLIMANNIIMCIEKRKKPMYILHAKPI